MPARLSHLRRNLRLCTYDGIAAVPLYYMLQPGNFIMAALLVSTFQLPPHVYGLIMSMPYWGNFAQAFLMPALNRTISPKTGSMTAALIQAVSWGALALAIGVLPERNPAASAPWFIALFAISAGATAVTGVSWTSWVQEWVPLRLRGKYFGSRNRFTQISQIVFLLSVGQLLLNRGTDTETFQLLIAAAVLLRIATVVFQYKIQTRAGALHEESRTPWREQLAVLARSSAFKWFVAFGAVWGFAANGVGPFYPVFMIEQLGLSLRDVSFFIVLTSIGGAASYPGWGALADRFGNKPVMLFAIIAWQLQYAVWPFLTRENAWLLYGLWTFAGIMNAGFTLCLFNIQLKLIPPAAKTLAISLNLAVTSLVTAVAPMLGGWALGHFIEAGHAPLRVYHALFVAQPVIALLGCFLLVRVHETNAQPLASVVGAMRNIRTVSAMLGLSFFVDFMFVKPARKKP
jgi:MFS family permease